MRLVWTGRIFLVGEGLGVSRLWGLLFELWGNFVLKLSINTKIVLRI